MQEIQLNLKNVLLPAIQVLAMCIALLYMFQLKKSYWKWFSIYLIIIFAQEYFWLQNTSLSIEYREGYYIFFGIPLQYMFLYWLYAFKSLKNKRIFIISVLTYIIALVLFSFFKELTEVYSLSINVGTIILTGLIILEFIKQIKNDDILKFYENKMFYINSGLIVFYIGSYPYQVFGKELYENDINLWNMCYSSFLISNCIMYLLFTASFIWGKTHSQSR